LPTHGLGVPVRYGVNGYMHREKYLGNVLE
jgi:hypothetical protein